MSLKLENCKNYLTPGFVKRAIIYRTCDFLKPVGSLQMTHLSCILESVFSIMLRKLHINLIITWKSCVNWQKFLLIANYMTIKYTFFSSGQLDIFYI